MALAFVFIGLPVISYLALAALPPGRPALIGIVIAALVIAGLWVTFGLASGDGFWIALVGFLFSAVSLAAIVQMIRQIIGVGKPRWVYPALVVAALGVAGIPMLTLLGG